MGIAVGTSHILNSFRKGVYKRKFIKSYNIYVDGELIRYKGMISDNLTKHDAEEAIAKTSYDYLINLIKLIRNHFNMSPNSVIVYLDGRRVTNKVVDRSDFKFDAGLIRAVFEMYCKDNGMDVKKLEVGDSELFMYINRDRSVDLNVFVTNDSDMISICYGHKPINYDCKEKLEISYDTTTTITTTTTTPIVVKAMPGLYAQHEQQQQRAIIDDNFVYSERNDVQDSCLWINCGKDIVAYGMDNTIDRLRLNAKQFRTFVALCGTDFTPSMFTETMVGSVMNCCCRGNDQDLIELDILNSITDINIITAGLLKISVKYGGTLKRDDQKCYPHDHDILEDMKILIETYITYMSEGLAETSIVFRPSMAYVSRLYLYAMIDSGAPKLTKAYLQAWSNATPMKVALDRFLNNVSDTNKRLLINSFIICNGKSNTKQQKTAKPTTTQATFATATNTTIITRPFSPSLLLSPLRKRFNRHDNDEEDDDAKNVVVKIKREKIEDATSVDRLPICHIKQERKDDEEVSDTTTITTTITTDDVIVSSTSVVSNASMW
jgi:hypothetical protein